MTFALLGSGRGVGRRVGLARRGIRGSVGVGCRVLGRSRSRVGGGGGVRIRGCVAGRRNDGVASVFCSGGGVFLGLFGAGRKAKAVAAAMCRMRIVCFLLLTRRLIRL